MEYRLEIRLSYPGCRSYSLTKSPNVTGNLTDSSSSNGSNPSSLSKRATIRAKLNESKPESNNLRLSDSAAKRLFCSAATRSNTDTTVDLIDIRLTPFRSYSAVTKADNCIDFAIPRTIDRRLKGKSTRVVTRITYVHVSDCAHCTEMAGLHASVF